MTQPIDIPGRPSRQIKDCLFPAEQGPYFGYIEILESGAAHWAVSSGADKYVTVGTQRCLPSLAFIVEKDLQRRTITIDIGSWSLKQSLFRAILNHTPSDGNVLDLNFDSLLRNYDALKLQAQRLKDREPQEDTTLELSLLVNDLLLERTLYDGIGMEQFRQRRVICVTHLEDIHRRNLDTGLDDIENCFVLGLTPDSLNADYLQALSLKYAEAAAVGDLDTLRSVCEPIVRGGEIVLHCDPPLLSRMLDGGYFEAYLYVLDVISRTRDTSTDPYDSHDFDVTFDPFYIAIRLGRNDAVQSFVRDKAFFDGHVYDDADLRRESRVFTPLSAAVFWGHAKIVRLLLKSSPIYLLGYQQAVGLASAAKMHQIMKLFTQYEQQSAPDTVVYASFLSRAPGNEMILPQQTPPRRGPGGTSDVEMSKSVSEITNGLNDYQTASPWELDRFSPQDDIMIDPQLLTSMFPSIPELDGVIVGEPLGMTDVSDPDIAISYGFVQPLPDGEIETGDSNRPFFRQRDAVLEKRKLGLDLVQRLSSRCKRLQKFDTLGLNTNIYARVMNAFKSMEDVWESGIEGFRRITRNEPPRDLVQVLQCLLVADALSQQLLPNDEQLQTQFVEDIGRWRTELSDEEQEAFNKIAKLVWDVGDVSALPTPGMNAGELYHFQEIIQNLVFLQQVHERRGHKKAQLEKRLRNLRKQILHQKRVLAANAAREKRRSMKSKTYTSIGNVLGRLTRDTDSMEEDEIDLGDFIHLEELEEEPTSKDGQVQESTLWPRTPWKDTNPRVVMLLASVAFSIVLVMVSVVQDGTATELLEAVTQSRTGYRRSCAIVEDFLDFKSTGNPSSDSEEVAGTTKVAKKSPMIETMKAATRNVIKAPPPLAVQSLGTSASSVYSRSVMSSPSGSSFLSTDFSSDNATRSRRLRCLSAQCPKTFSSVSNRNKHMREGCAFRDKKGYPCRNGNCSKVLTTKWYRNTHEQNRCRYR